MADKPQEDAIVMRCQAAVIRALTGDHAQVRLGELVADLSLLPADRPERGRIAAGILMALFRGQALVAPESVPHLGDLLRIAEDDPPAEPTWGQVRSLARMTSSAYSALNGATPDFAVMHDEMAALAASVGDHPQLEAVMAGANMVREFSQAIEDGNESVLHRMPAELAKFVGKVEDQPELASLMRSLGLGAEAMAANQRGEHTEALKYVEHFRESTENRPPDDFLRVAATEVATQLTALVGTFTGSDAVGAAPQLDDDQLAELAALANRPDATDHDRAMNQLVLGGVCLRSGKETKLDRIEEGIGHYREALRLTPAAGRLYAFCLQSVALGLFRRTEVAGNTDGLDEAAQLLERARLLLGARHPQWTLATNLLAEIRHRLGDVRGAGEIGLAARRGHAWRALLESDAAGMKIAIKDAAREAIDLARRCLQAHNLADAVRALDTCRGLMLFAATELRRIPARLDAAGHAELARRWEAEGSASNELRGEVLSVLAEQPDVAGLLDPPSLDEIRSALTRLDADALVYLVPADLPKPGMAVIAPADGDLAWIPLTNLTVTEDVDRYLAVLATRDLVPPRADDQVTGSIAALCDWAWRAAIGPLLDQYFADQPRPDGREPRVVLIPMGDLARVPWQAARRGDGTYAVELAAFSQAVSARLLCENAASAPVALTSSGMVVADPDTAGAARDLGAARREAHAIRRAFYQGARYVGRRVNGSDSPSGRGTADDVRHWLTAPGPAAGAMLHLACHGSFTTGLDDAKSCLLLAAGELAAEEILELLAAVPERQVGLVVLAACNTGRSVHGYDEAYSLGTAFLAGGVRSVLSTQWSIPDAQTPSLMYLFHHYCRQEHLPPWQALRKAQIWMLNPGRRAPERMPAELLAAIPDGEPAPLASWAGFVHFGQ